MDLPTPPSSRPRAVLAALAAGGVLAVLGAPSRAHAQSAAVDPSTAPADSPASAREATTSAYRFDGREIYLGAGPGLLPQEGEAGLATRLQLVFPVGAEWFAIEAGGMGQLIAVDDHHGNRVEVNAGSITTGARFAFPVDSTIRPYGAVRFAHLHFFPDPFGEHGHDSGAADHEYHHRWGAGGAIGFDTGIPEPTSRFRLGVEAEAFALTGPGIDVIGQMVATFGIGF